MSPNPLCPSLPYFIARKMSMTDFDVPNITRLNLSSRSDDGEGEEEEEDVQS